ncbi:hypothetical protein M3P05_00920 [Sansalvadorimonas sp. 2012CJ34-2]|uniref:BZIP domain-containing protein n=1 Tax=Parendozoicomonas callyspongiae TaxID=2942213 RepID=A0ABT0PD92_9GAMM|nr:hypothetical protein [Sansalvadorimonas sp. 2012CJ34-2]MCL6268513.1 hypothetical protein [Sansalvadorimonas sp. 2012CJ34-2]
MKSEDKGPASLQSIQGVNGSQEERPAPQKTGFFNGWKVSVVEAWHTFVNTVMVLFGFEPKYQDSSQTARATPQAGETTTETPKEQPILNRHIAPESSVKSVITADKPSSIVSHEETPASSLLQRPNSFLEPVVLEDPPELDDQIVQQQNDNTVAEETSLELNEKEGSLSATSIDTPDTPHVSISNVSVDEDDTPTEHSLELKENEPELSVENPSVSRSLHVEEALPLALQQEIEICELLATPPQKNEVTTDAAGDDIQLMNYCSYLDGNKQAEEAEWPFGIERKYDFQEFLYVARLGKSVIEAAGTTKEKTRLGKFFNNALKQIPASLEQAGIDRHGASTGQPVISPEEVEQQTPKGTKKKKVKNAAKGARKNRFRREIDKRRNKVSAFDQALEDLVKQNPAVINLWVHHYKNHEAKKGQAQEQ